MKKIIEWFKASNRWKHLLGGIILGLFSNTVYCATLVGFASAFSLEFKDKQWGGEFDWIDFALTCLGVAVGYIIHGFIFGFCLI